ncbi:MULTISPECIES: DNA-binding domain-containing protein [unclassified Pseudomonas]|uniref:DNA-binding domain-containing protein n=1 Tax=unclassified Pseudomonas TaxID=196821 RepID=UPI002AC95252|nr:MULTISPECIES: DNA-binding domain-containing protein [unclassified Pseudomonas]MEB0047096.1 DNA-binding domain-containing protein [Pseudomonas sp. Dout3]MEB0098495.1 DNA-binding domain-containing protein [Pseudomonas sp. DC1.2]WPX58909.1 DNA-binding domain-containing protein [Pseudomonas sp. DC1.2]
MRLNDWQLAFEDYLLGDTAAPNPALSRSLIGGPSLDVGAGLAIYHHAYQARLQEVLRGDYPTLWHWLGDDEFEQLVAAYIRQFPSNHYSLRWLGKGFEAFIRQYLVPEQSAALAELAAVEWAFTLAFDAPVGRSLTVQDMVQLPAEDWATLRVSLGPSVQSIPCAFNSIALWRAVKAETDFPRSVAVDEPETLVIWRAGLVCHYRCLAGAEASALKYMTKQGASFSELCLDLVVIYGEGASLQAVTWLKQWIYDGWLERREP